MNKLICVTLALVLCLGLFAGCAEKSVDDTDLTADVPLVEVTAEPSAVTTSEVVETAEPIAVGYRCLTDIRLIPADKLTYSELWAARDSTDSNIWNELFLSEINDAVVAAGYDIGLATGQPVTPEAGAYQREYLYGELNADSPAMGYLPGVFWDRDSDKDALLPWSSSNEVVLTSGGVVETVRWSDTIRFRQVVKGFRVVDGYLEVTVADAGSLTLFDHTYVDDYDKMADDIVALGNIFLFSSGWLIDSTFIETIQLTAGEVLVNDFIDETKLNRVGSLILLFYQNEIVEFDDGIFVVRGYYNTTGDTLFKWRQG